MDNFSRNYWSLYLNFIKDFENLSYKGFSIPYLCQLPAFVLHNKKIIKELNGKKFINKIERRVDNQKQLQEAFFKFIESHKKDSPKNPPLGKVVIYIEKLLRFPSDFFIKYLDSSKTIKLISVNNNRSKEKILSKKYPSLHNNTSHKKSKLKKKGLVSLSSNSVLKRRNIKKNRLGKSSETLKDNRGSKEIRSVYLHAYRSNKSTSIKRLQNQARSMFKSYERHYMYNDKNFQNWFLTSISNVVNHIEMSENFLDHVPVSCIVVSTTNHFKNRVMALVALERGIPTICMQHGIVASELGYIPKIATIDAVYGEFEKEFYKKLGASEESIEVIGHPRFDKKFKTPRISKNKFYSTLGIDPKKKTIMIALRGERDYSKWQQLIETISKKININILVKNYPSIQPHKLTKKFSFVQPTNNYDIYDIFPHVDAVVCYPSTVGLEAMHSNKPVFILDKDFAGDTGYYDKLDQLIQTNPQILGELIVKFFKDTKLKNYVDKKRREFIHYAYPGTLKSGERLKNLIDRIAK